MKRIFLGLFLLCNCFLTLAYSDIQKIEYFDTKFYHPDEIGLRDLVFKLKISGLEEELTREKIFGKIENLYFQVYWQHPGKIYIEVYGLPAGFDQRIEMLRQLVRTRMDFVIPQRLAPQMRSYTFVTKTEDGNVVYLGEDKSGKIQQREVKLVFDNKNRLLSIKSVGTLGVNETKMNMVKKDWSKGLFVLDEMTSQMTAMNNVVTTMNHQFSYLVENGFGLPEKITIKTNYKAPGVSDKTKDIENVYTFSSYQVNTGRAKKTIDIFEKANKK